MTSLTISNEDLSDMGAMTNLVNEFEHLQEQAKLKKKFKNFHH